jgi:hypothetical protein
MAEQHVSAVRRSPDQFDICGRGPEEQVLDLTRGDMLTLLDEIIEAVRPSAAERCDLACQILEPNRATRGRPVEAYREGLDVWEPAVIVRSEPGRGYLVAFDDGSTTWTEKARMH